MIEKIWLVWAVIAAVFVVAEIFTAGFFLVWFGIGAAVAAVIAFIGLGVGVQWFAFAIVSIVLFFASRKFADRVTKKQPKGIGADRVVDKIGVVIDKIDPVANSGSVRVEKEEWKAVSDKGQVVENGSKVKVIRVEGTHLVVKEVATLRGE